MIRHRVEAALQSAVVEWVEAPATDLDATPCPPRLRAALRAAVFPGGARLRPALALAVARACGDDDPPLADAVAVSVELLHCASLVHDDLPCFDDADLRRGEPTVHRRFGEATAVLVGDALIVRALEVLAEAGRGHPERVARLVRTISGGVGARGGLVAGQAWEAEPRAALVQYHRAKTAALFVAAAAGGAQAAGADPRPWRPMARALGEAYQVADDLADALGDASALGKPLGRDEALGRPSAVRALGIDGAYARLADLSAAAIDAVPSGPRRGEVVQLLESACHRLVPSTPQRAAAG